MSRKSNKVDAARLPAVSIEPVAPDEQTAGPREVEPRRSRYLTSYEDPATKPRLRTTAELSRVRFGDANTLGESAQLGWELQQAFNGERPRARFAEPKSADLGWVEEWRGRQLVSNTRVFQHDFRAGSAPFWDLSAEQARRFVRYTGSGENPFVLPNGGFRLYLHYMNVEDQERVRRALGAPTGSAPATMLDSTRSLGVETEQGPWELKFSIKGAIANSLEKELKSKLLEPSEVRSAVRATEAVAGDPHYIPEPAALVIDLHDGGPKIAMLCRKVPIASRGYQPGDLAVPEHVVFDSSFARTELGRKIFGGDAPDAQPGWMRRVLAPKIAEFLWHGLTTSHFHFEMHPQNLVLIFDMNGTLLEVVAKDLQDLKNDVRGRAAAGQPFALTHGWKVMDERKKAIAEYYDTYLGQVGMPDRPFMTIDDLRQNPMYHAIAEELAKRAGDDQRLARFADTPEYAAVFEAEASKQPGRLIANLRDLLVRADDQERLAGSPSVGDRLGVAVRDLLGKL